MVLLVRALFVKFQNWICFTYDLQVRSSNEECQIEVDTKTIGVEPSVEFHFGRKSLFGVIVGIPRLSARVSCHAFYMALLKFVHIFSICIVANVSKEDGDQLSLSTADFKYQDIAMQLNQRRWLSQLDYRCMPIKCARTHMCTQCCRRQKIIFDETKEMDPEFANFYKETQDIVNETLMKEGGILVKQITDDDDVSLLYIGYMFALRLLVMCTISCDVVKLFQSSLTLH